MSKALWIAVCLALLSACGAELPTGDSASEDRLQVALGGDPDAFERAVGPRVFSFPRDHGPHNTFRNEWWYFTGVLTAAGGATFGYELTFFRVALSATPNEGWRTSQLYLAHFALSDVDSQRFVAHERIARAAAGLAGAQSQPFSVCVSSAS